MVSTVYGPIHSRIDFPPSFLSKLTLRLQVDIPCSLLDVFYGEVHVLFSCERGVVTYVDVLLEPLDCVLPKMGLERRGSDGDRRLGNSPKTSADGTIPSGPSVFFIALTANVRRSCRCIDG